MSFEDTKIPENERANFLSVYWQMLREIEASTDPDKDPLNKLLVKGGYDLLNRIGATRHRPAWEKKEPTPCP